MLTLKEIIILEPKINDIFNIAKTKPKRNYHAFEEMKIKLKKYVGFYSENPRLQNNKAYELCINRLSAILKI